MEVVDLLPYAVVFVCGAWFGIAIMCLMNASRNEEEQKDAENNR